MGNPLHEQRAKVASCESSSWAWPCAAIRLSPFIVVWLLVTVSRQQGAAALHSHAAQRASEETFIVLHAGVVKRGRVNIKLPGLHFHNFRRELFTSQQQFGSVWGFFSKKTAHCESRKQPHIELKLTSPGGLLPFLNVHLISRYLNNPLKEITIQIRFNVLKVPS